MWVLLIGVLLAASPSSHRAKAERAETLGHMPEAAREYEAAWQEEQAPELLYRLGIVRRKLKQYGKAREAFRAYLRDAPEGGLREEVERQLKKIEVLIEAQSEEYADEPGPQRKSARAPPAVVQPVPPVVQPVEPVHPVEPATPPPAGEQRSPGPSEQVNSVHQPAAPPVPATVFAPTPAPPSRPRVAPWLAAGAAVTAAAGAYLWWDGAGVTHDLDAKYASGDLTPADHASYSRAHNESVAGRVLVAAAVALGAAAVILW